MHSCKYIAIYKPLLGHKKCVGDHEGSIYMYR